MVFVSYWTQVGPKFLSKRFVTSGLSLANIGNDSRTIRKDGEAPVRVVFDLEARRKPQVFAADAVSLWNFNRRLLILKELLLYSTKLMERSYPAHGPSIWHNAASAAPAASFLSPIRTFDESSVRQDKPGAFSGCNSRPGKGKSRPTGNRVLGS